MNKRKALNECNALSECRIIATYAVGVIGDQPFLYNDLVPNSNINRLIGYCVQAGARPVAYINVRQDAQFKNGQPQYHCTYFCPKDEGCACNGGVHEPAYADDVNVLAGAVDYIKKGSNGTGMLPNRTEAEKNFAASE